jgi:predicted thioesterase
MFTSTPGKPYILLPSIDTYMSTAETFSRVYTVSKEHLAKHVSFEGTGILSTPSLIAFMEEASRIFLDSKLPQNQTTVGVHIDVYHAAPALLGTQVEIRGRVLRSSGRRVFLWLEAWSGETLIGYGVHERAVIDKTEYAGRIASMIASKIGG